MHIRDSYTRNMHKMLNILKNKSETCLTVAAERSTVDDKNYVHCVAYLDIQLRPKIILLILYIII